MLNSTLVKVQGLTKTYSRFDLNEEVLKGVDLDIQTGEFVALVGPSGSGKSTLLHLMGLMDQPTTGHVYFEGKALENAAEAVRDEFRRTNLGFIFQTFNLMSRLTALENVEISLLGLESSRAKRMAKAEEALQQVGMREHANKFPRQLSGGQRQRVACARAIVHGPRLILADEPTANLDRTHGMAVVELLASLKKNLQLTVVMASHDPEVYAKADRVLKLQGGRVV